MANKLTKIFARFGVVALLGLSGACGAQDGDDALVGQWTRWRADPMEVRDQYTFGADGSFAFDENKPDSPATEDHVKGTYTAMDGIFVVTGTNGADPARVRGSSTYYVNATELWSAALRPEGAHDGVVGLWTGLRRTEQLDKPAEASVGSVENVRFAADGTYRWTSAPAGNSGVVVRDGTWALEGVDLIRMSSTPLALTPATTTTLKLVDGAALVSPGPVWHRSDAP